MQLKPIPTALAHALAKDLLRSRHTRAHAHVTPTHRVLTIKGRVPHRQPCACASLRVSARTRARARVKRGMRARPHGPVGNPKPPSSQCRVGRFFFSSEECGPRRSRGRCSQRVCVWCQLSGQATWTTQTAPKTSTPQTNPMTPMPIMPGPGPVKLRCRSGPLSCASNRLCISVCVGACRCVCIGLRARVCVSVGSNEGGASRVW